MDARWVELPVHDGKGGHLLALETGRGVPFPVRRIFAIYGQDPAAPRGRHAHREGEQLLVCLGGSCRLTLRDGREERVFVLADARRALHVGPRVWEELDDFAPGTVLLCLASTAYDPANYVTDHDEFLRIAGP